MRSVNVSHVQLLSFLLWGRSNEILTVDLLLVFRDGRSHGDGCSNTEGSAERTEWRRDAAGDGQVPFCVFGQGLTRLLLYMYNMAQCIDLAVAVNGFLTCDCKQGHSVCHVTLALYADVCRFDKKTARNHRVVWLCIPHESLYESVKL